MNKLRQLAKKVVNSYYDNQTYPVYQGPPKSGYDRETILKKVSQVPFWWHTIELGHGLVTPGRQGNRPSSARNLIRHMPLPADLTGNSVLDIGAWDGFYSFECERRGADRVLAIDNFYRMENEAAHLDSQARGFEIAKDILASQVEFRALDVMDIIPETTGTFDIVLLLGVLYHLKHPLLALEKVAAVTKQMMIIETHFERRGGSRPLAYFYERDEMNLDTTNWWGPNQACLEAMIRTAGFKEVTCEYRVQNRIIMKASK